MGWDIISLGRHRLDVSDAGALARQLSRSLKINIEHGYDREYMLNELDGTVTWNPDYDWIRLGEEVFSPGAPEYRLDDMLFCQRDILQRCTEAGLNPKFADGTPSFSIEEEIVRFFLDEKGDSRGLVYFLDIGQEICEISLYDDPGRWSGFYRYFGDREDRRADMEDLMEFRKNMYEAAKALGCGGVYIFSDQGPTEWIEEQQYGSWEDLEKYIKEGKWLEDANRGKSDKWGKLHHSFQIIDIPKFLSSEQPELSRWYNDIFWDDFSDLEKTNVTR